MVGFKQLRFKKILLALTAAFCAAMLLPGAAWSDTNIALNKSVTLNGTFFVGGWGGGATVDKGTVVDGIFFPERTEWDQGAVWWDNNFFGGQNIEIDLGGSFRINSFIVQADNNDTYRVSYLDSGVWKSAWEVPAWGGYGLITRPTENLLTPIITTALKFEATGGDDLYSVSEIQAFGQAPVPPSVLLLGSGILSLMGWRRLRRD